MLSSLEQTFATQQIGFPILTLLIFLPVLVAIGLVFVRNEKQIRLMALGGSFVTFLLSLLLPIFFERGKSDMQFVEQLSWISPLGVSYHVGTDGINILLMVLTTFLLFLIFLFSWEGVGEYLKQYMICLLVLETTIIGVFAALDVFLFFLFWEIMLIPMYFLIKTWGGPNRDYASLKFVLYTLVGSVLMLVGFVILYLNHHALTGVYSFDFLDLLKSPLSAEKQNWVFLLLFFGFAFKVPMFPFHTWLPDAHVEAPTAGSVLLAGVLLKMGTYGFIRFSLPLLPQASEHFMPMMVLLGGIGIVYGAWLALAQDDIKKLIAYSSISHLGFVIIGIFTLNEVGISGGLIQMVNHGVSTGGLFLIVGFLYERRHTRAISEYGGLTKQVPVLAAFYLLISLSSMGMPGTNGFIGEFMIALGAWKRNPLYVVPVVIGIILGAAYLLWLYQRTMMGELTNPKNKNLKDLSPREFGICAALTVMILWVGVYPTPFLKMMEGSVQYITSRFESGMVSKEHTLKVSPVALPTLDDFGDGFNDSLGPEKTPTFKQTALMTIPDTQKDEGSDDH